MGLSILDMSKTVMHGFWFDYIKPKYGEKAKVYFVDTESLIVHLKRNDIYKDIAEDIQTRFDSSNSKLDWPLTKVKQQ